MYIPLGKNTGKPTSTSARVFPNYGCCSKNNLYYVKDYGILYNNTVRPLICEGWHFTYMWKALA